MENNNSFDNAASNYDDNFTNSSIGIAQRKRVYQSLKKTNFTGGARSIFEINCGTGFDAEYFYNLSLQVVATDGSKKMIETARKSRNSEIIFKQLQFSEVNKETIEGEAVFSNFGGLNCLSKTELNSLLNRISVKQKSGEKIALVIMPKYCLMEGLYFFFRGKWKQMFRRSNSKGTEINVDGTKIKTFFHSPNQVKSMLSDYEILLKKPVALFLPPSYMQAFFDKRPKLLRFLDKLEGTFGKLSFFSGWSDHFIIVAEKK